MMENFEEPLGDERRRLLEQELRKDLHQFLLSMKEVDERMPECPDVEEKWEEIAKTYIPDQRPTSLTASASFRTSRRPRLVG